MKTHTLILVLVALFLAAGMQAADIERMDPPFWYAGMKNQELQVMFYGQDIASYEFSLKAYPGIRVKEVAKVQNPNYLIVYLDVTEKARPGVMTFRFKEGGRTTEKAFELRPRNTKTGAQGFSKRDVLYLIMPDLNQRNRHLATSLIQNSIWWIEYARIDGIRMDTYPYADYNFMVRWCREIEAAYPSFNIVGEGWYPRNSAAGLFKVYETISHPSHRSRSHCPPWRLCPRAAIR